METQLYLHFVHPLHVVAQLLQILDVAIADLANNKLRLIVTAGTLAGLHSCCRLGRFAGRGTRTGAHRALTR